MICWAYEDVVFLLHGYILWRTDDSLKQDHSLLAEATDVPKVAWEHSAEYRR